MNTILAKSLRAYCNNEQEKWVTYLPSILMGLRMSVNSTTKETSFKVMFGSEMRTPIDCALLPKASLGQTVKDYLYDIQNALKMLPMKTQQRQNKNKSSTTIKYS